MRKYASAMPKGVDWSNQGRLVEHRGEHSPVNFDTCKFQQYMPGINLG